MRNEKVYTLLVMLKFDLELCPRELAGLQKCLSGYESKPVLHSNRTLGFVIVSRENQAVLAGNLARHLLRNCIEKYYIFPCPYDVTAMDGSMDPFATAALEAYDAVRKRREAKNMPPPQTPREVFSRFGVKNPEIRTAVKVGMEGGRRRNPPRNA